MIGATAYDIFISMRANTEVEPFQRKPLAREANVGQEGKSYQLLFTFGQSVLKPGIQLMQPI